MVIALLGEMALEHRTEGFGLLQYNPDLLRRATKNNQISGKFSLKKVRPKLTNNVAIIAPTKVPLPPTATQTTISIEKATSI